MAKNNKSFITFEGGEGTGKSTVSNLLLIKLNEELYSNFFLTREPGGNGIPFAEKIRELIFEGEDIDPITEALLYQASRREHITKVITPELNKNNIVLCDRFTDSSLIYQGYARGVGEKVINTLNNISTMGVMPSLTFIFDLDPKIGQSRINDNINREQNRFDTESLDFHNEVRKRYLSLIEKDKKRYILIDASKPVEETVNEIFEYIKKHIKKIETINKKSYKKMNKQNPKY